MMFGRYENASISSSSSSKMLGPLTAQRSCPSHSVKGRGILIVEDLEMPCFFDGEDGAGEGGAEDY